MKTIISLIVSLVICFPAYSQSPPGPFLTNADIDRFIETSNQMMAEFVAIDEPEEIDESEDETYEEILKSYQEALKDESAVKILKKYGWEPETYGQKSMAITLGMTYLLTEKYMKDMPAEQQAVMQEMFVKQYKSMVHPDDIKLLKPRIDELEKFFQQE